MSTIRKVLTSTFALAFVFGGASALAETQEGWRKGKKKRATISRSGQIGGFNFWGSGWGSDENSRQFDDSRRRYTPPKTTSAAAKIYTYSPERLHVLADLQATQPKPQMPIFSANAPKSYNPTPDELRFTKLNDSLAQTIYELIRDGDTGIRVTKTQRNEIADYYRRRGYLALWTSMEGLEESGRQLMAVLKDADTEGLDASNYRLPEIDRKGGLEALETELAAIARLDIQLTAMAVRYAMHASGGRIVANRLSAYHDLKPSRVSAASALAGLTKSDDPGEYLRSLHPRHQAYAQLKNALAEERASIATVVAEEPIPSGPTIAPGEYDNRIPDIRRRLIKDGHLEAASVEIIPSSGEELPTAEPAVLDAAEDENDTLYHPGLVDAVKDFQRSAGLKPDGLIGRRTIGAMNGTVEQKVDKVGSIIANMERLRWLPRHLGRDHIFVNQASYRLQVVKGGRTAWSTKVIVGKPQNQTSFFSDEMETVVFNPYWGVPQSIITNEMIPRLVNDPGYLDRLGYEVYSTSGRRVSSYDVNWWGYDISRPVAVRQPPGRKNALGEVKFLFPNKHAIYLHDTPTKKLFDRSQRAFSHGCVRVQNPRQLAQAVLGWDQERIASHISTGRNQKISLKRKIPVHLTYFTAWPSAGGKVNYYKDMYGRDERLKLAFSATSAAFRQ